jgi:hypothetical protein
MRNGMGWAFCLMSFVGACVSHSQVDRADAGVVEPAPPEAGSCATVVLTSRDDYEAARDCIRIDGDLLVSADSSVDRLEFPRLIEITGKISPVYVELPHLLRTLRFPVLQNVGGSVELSATRAAKVAWPELRTIGGNLTVDVSPELVSFAAPKLEHVGGTVEFASDLELKRLDLPELERRRRRPRDHRRLSTRRAETGVDRFGRWSGSTRWLVSPESRRAHSDLERGRQEPADRRVRLLRS